MRSLSKFLGNIETQTSEIVDVEWHPINKNNLSVVWKKGVSILYVKDDLECIFQNNNHIGSNITKFQWDPSGELSLVIAKNGHQFYLLDSNFKILFSKSFFSILSPFSFFSNPIKDITWASDSSYFILYTKSSLYLYNTLNLSFKTWSDFKGNILNVIITENSDYILIFTDDEANPMFIIYNIEEDFYNLANYNSFNNISRYFHHLNYQVPYRNFSFFYSENKIMVKVRLNLNNNRVVILYKDITTSRQELKIFALENLNSVHDIKIDPICTISNFKEFRVGDFELYYDFFEKEDVLFILWDDKYLSKTYLNANEVKIN